MDLFDRKLQEDYANRAAAAAAAQVRADEAARYAMAQRAHERELEEQREWAKTELHSQERTHKRMSGIHLAIPVFSKGYRPKQGKVAP